MTTSAILWPVLRRILIHIGRWVLRNCIVEGARALAVYLRMRARHFAERRAGESSKPLRARLARRAQRYLRASRWFVDHTARLTSRALQTFDRLSSEIPDQSPWESR